MGTNLLVPAVPCMDPYEYPIHLTELVEPASFWEPDPVPFEDPVQEASGSAVTGK